MSAHTSPVFPGVNGAEIIRQSLVFLAEYGKFFVLPPLNPVAVFVRISTGPVESVGNLMRDEETDFPHDFLIRHSTVIHFSSGKPAADKNTVVRGAVITVYAGRF